MQTQGSKNSSCSEKPKPKDLKPAPSRDNAAEPAKKEDKKDKKKKFWNQRRDYIKEQTSATGVNTKAPKKKTRPDGSTIIRKATIQISAPNL